MWVGMEYIEEMTGKLPAMILLSIPQCSSTTANRGANSPTTQTDLLTGCPDHKKQKRKCEACVLTLPTSNDNEVGHTEPYLSYPLSLKFKGSQEEE